MYQKRIVWIGFLIVFLLLIPVLLSQAMGYKYNWHKHRFEATGILFVKTYPKDVDIILDDELIDTKTPSQLAKILPGIYNLKISKNNYLPWEKNIVINEHSTTFVEDVVLFSRSLPSPIGKFELIDYLTNNSNEYILLSKHNGKTNIISYNTNDHTTKILKEWDNPINIQLLSLSPNNEKLIYSENSAYKLLLINSPFIDEQLTGLSKSYWQDIAWDATNDNIIYSQIGSTLSEINISTLPVSITATTRNIIDFFTHESKVYFLTRSEEGNQVILHQAERKFTNVEQLILLPYTTALRYIPSNGMLSLLDPTNNFLYLIDTAQSDIIVKVYPNVSNAKWYDVNYDKILYWNSNEISVYFKDREQSQLITRLGDPIKDTWWHPNGAYIFYQQADKIHIIEFDERDKKNNYEIVTLDNDSFFTVNSKGDEIIYYSTHQQTLYKQVIQ